MSSRGCSEAAIVGNGLWKQHGPKEEDECADAIIQRLALPYCLIHRYFTHESQEIAILKAASFNKMGERVQRARWPARDEAEIPKVQVASTRLHLFLLSNRKWGVVFSTNQRNGLF